MCVKIDTYSYKVHVYQCTRYDLVCSASPSTKQSTSPCAFYSYFQSELSTLFQLINVLLIHKLFKLETIWNIQKRVSCILDPVWYQKPTSPCALCSYFPTELSGLSYMLNVLIIHRLMQFDKIRNIQKSASWI